MIERRRLAYLLAATALGSSGAVLATGLSAGPSGLTPTLAGTILALAGPALAWIVLDRSILRPARQAGRLLRALVTSGRTDGISDHDHPLSARDLPQLAAKLDAVRTATDTTLAHMSARGQEHRAWLDAVLRDLADGVVVCGLDHRVRLFNPTAQRLLDQQVGLAAGQPLFAQIAREPVAHALDVLLGRGGGQSVPFVAARTDAARLIQGDMALILGHDSQPAGYVVTIREMNAQSEILARDAHMRRMLARDLRAPLSSLKAAAETIAAYPGMNGRERAAFDEVIIEEADKLAKRLEEADHHFRSQSAARWMMADMSSQDLFNCLARDLAKDGIILIMVGIPLWLHGDSHALLLAFRRMITGIAARTGRKCLEIEAMLSDRHIYLDIRWMGDPIGASIIEGWMSDPLDGAIGAQSLRDIMDRHGSEPWSQRLPGGATILRVPLPAPTRPIFIAPEHPTPRRPEIFDPFLLARHSQPSPLGGKRLDQLDLVVLDLETTGLDPDQDSIIQIGAVRVSQGRVQPQHCFDRLINPRRAIPASGQVFHGITDAMVADKPPIEVVIPQLKSFVGDAVLVAHNAVFDLKFLAAQEQATGHSLTNPVLDTMLIAGLLDPDLDGSLESLGRHLGVTVDSRRSALGDAMATAEILVRQFQLLADRGIVTLDDALAASAKASSLRQRRGP